MASLSSLLADTLLHTAARASNRVPQVVDAFDVPKPTPQPLEGIDDTDDQISVVRRNKIWHWRHGPTPGIFHSLTCKVRGMGMNYNHAMPVADAIVVDSVRVQRTGQSGWLSLPLLDEYVVRKEFMRSGTVPNGAHSWWPCRLPLDASGLIVLAYELGPDGKPTRLRDKALLDSDAFMPDVGWAASFRLTAGEQNEALVVLDRVRYLVIIELCSGREDDTFVPGSGIGFARLHPLVWVVSSERLDNVEVQTTVQRPSASMSHGDDTMESAINMLATTDSNQATVAFWPLGQKKVIPYWSDFFTATEDDPAGVFGKRIPESYDHPLQVTGEVTAVDPRYDWTRVIERAIMRRKPGFDVDEGIWDSVTKLPSQGQIDNVHMAPRMRISFEQDGIPTTLTGIAMAPFCIHDCLHVHWRWGVVHDEKEIRGFSGTTPHQIAGGTTVPGNQVVFLSFPNRYTLRQRCIAGVGAACSEDPKRAEQDAVKPGVAQLFGHQGFGYVSDLFPGTLGRLAIDGIKTVVEMNAGAVGEPYDDMPDTSDGWARLYWRLRYGGRGDQQVERLTTEWEKVLRPE